jgi:hypothetical protein
MGFAASTIVYTSGICTVWFTANEQVLRKNPRADGEGGGVALSWCAASWRVAMLMIARTPRKIRSQKSERPVYLTLELGRRW